MLRMIFSVVCLLVPGAAIAHPGHLVGAGGHDHWIALGAIGLAAALGLWGVLKDKKHGDDDAKPVEDSADESTDGEEVPA